MSLLTGACRSLAAVALLTVAACKGNSGQRIDWNALKAEFAPRVAGLTQNEFVLLV